MSGNSTEARDRIAALLKRYPALDAAEMAELHHLFTRKASALDLGLLAGDPAVAAQFRSYRTEHHDRFKPRDIGKVALFVGAAVAVLGGMILMIPQ